MHTPATGRAIRFGPFQVDPRTRELRKGRTRIRVADQSIRILLALLDRAGDVVTREELAAILWPHDTDVDVEHGLNSAVRRLRDAIGDSVDRPVFIETVPRIGYRFIGVVEPPGSASAPSAPVAETRAAIAPAPEPPPDRLRSESRGRVRPAPHHEGDRCEQCEPVARRASRGVRRLTAKRSGLVVSTRLRGRPLCEPRGPDVRRHPCREPHVEPRRPRVRLRPQPS